MKRKRIKVIKGMSDFVPTTVSFTTLERRVKDGDLQEFDPSDGNLEEIRMQSSLEYEEMVVQILTNLEDREKLIFAFQLLRDSGYQIDHGSFAKTIKITRSQYMKVLKDVRLKSALFVIGYNNSPKDTNKSRKP